MEIENEVKFIRLVTGEDILAEIITIDEKNCKIVNPMKILYSSTTTGTMTISLMQWVFTRISTEQSFDLPMVNILTSSPPSDNLKSYYWETVEHFFNKKVEITYDNEEDIYDDIDEENGLELLKDVLQSLSDKRKLH